MSKRAPKVAQTKIREEQQHEKKPEKLKRKEMRPGFFIILLQTIYVWGSIILMFSAALWLNYVLVYNSSHLDNGIKEMMHFSKKVTIPRVIIKDRLIIPETSVKFTILNFSFMCVLIALLFCW